MIRPNPLAILTYWRRARHRLPSLLGQQSSVTFKWPILRHDAIRFRRRQKAPIRHLPDSSARRLLPRFADPRQQYCRRRVSSPPGSDLSRSGRFGVRSFFADIATLAAQRGFTAERSPRGGFVMLRNRRTAEAVKKPNGVGRFTLEEAAAFLRALPIRSAE